MKNYKLVLTLIIMVFTSGCLAAQDDDETAARTPISEPNLETSSRNTFFGDEVPFNAQEHMEMLQLLLRMNWYDNESVFVPQLSDTTIELSRVNFSDFQKRTVRIYENPEARSNYTASLTFNPNGLITQYIEEITPQSEHDSSVLASYGQIDVDYQNELIRHQYSRDDGFQYDITYRIRAFESPQGDTALFIDSALGRLRAIQKMNDHYYLYIGRKDESDPVFGLRFDPIGRIYQKEDILGYQIFYNWDPNILNYETIFENSKEIEYLKYDYISQELRFRRTAFPEREYMYDIYTDDLFDGTSTSEFRINRIYDENNVLVYEAIEFPDGSGEEQFIRYIE